MWGTIPGMRRKFRTWLYKLLRLTAEKQDQSRLINRLNEALVDLSARDNPQRARYLESVAELVEARQMMGSGPWQVSPAALQRTDGIIEDARLNYGQSRGFRESLAAQGATGDLELALMNVEWRREVNLSWMEFSRWGIQQLILICRLYYIKHPWIRRGVNLSAAYVFGQGVELSSPDPDANEVLKRFRERNKVTLGQIALTEQEKRKSYDGNIFWCLFADTQNTGDVNVRVIDATEIQEIICDPNDAERPWYYKRVWQQKTFDAVNGIWSHQPQTRWYPALNYEPDLRPETIGTYPVAWNSPIYHRKVGHVANWAFGCPRVYPAIDWSKEGRRHLEACSSVTQAHSQIALDITTKGGQQAIMGLKQQLGTTVGPTSSIWDENPPAVAGSTFAHGPGMKLEAFKVRGYGANPEEIKEYRNMVACCLDIPPTWLGDMETSNLSTAQTLDRPTELGFLLKQEEWQEDLTVMGIYALRVSQGAPSGLLREALQLRSEKEPLKVEVEIREAGRRQLHGHWVYEAAKIKQPGVVEVLCNFPAIREGDIPSLVTATVQSMTLGQQGIGGIDEKAGVRRLYDLVGIDDGDQLTEEMYPAASYDMDRTKDEPEPDPNVEPKILPESAQIRAALRRINRALEVRESAATR